MHENIRVNNPNFCIGPQAGTYCSVDNSVDPVVLHVKNESGTLIRTYDFYPQDLLVSGPYTYNAPQSIVPDYFYHEFVSIKYIGPTDQNSYFDGAVFYTLEKRAQVVREYYTYERDPEPFGPYKMDILYSIPPTRPEPYNIYNIATVSGTLLTSTRPEYNSNIIRRWLLDTANFRLVLDQTIIKNSDTIDWFDGDAFTVQNVIAPMTSHSAIGSEEIFLTTTSGIKKYDVLMLGPSGDVDNLGAVEEVYVHSISGNTVTVKTYEGYIPPKYDYVAGDMVTSFQDIALFSNARPVINSVDIAYEYTSASGTLYCLDQTNYGAVLHREYNGMFSDIKATAWNHYFNSLSFVKGTNLLHLSLNDYEMQLSQNIGLEYPLEAKVIILYDIDIKGITIYKLQKQIMQRDDAGLYVLMDWITYNYHEDSLIPYTYSVSLEASEKILLIIDITYITVIVRDQFGVGLLNKNIWITTEGDSGSSIIPTDGYLVSDADGRASTRYDAGNYVDAETTVFAKVDGSNVTYGSAYVVANIHLTQHTEFLTDMFSPSFPEYSSSTSVVGKDEYEANLDLYAVVSFMYPYNNLDDELLWRSYSTSPKDHSPTIKTVALPVLHTVSLGDTYMHGDKRIWAYSSMYVFQRALSPVTTDITSNTEAAGKQYLSQNFVSRHLLYGHTDNIELDQFIFVQESIPEMWSEKNNVDTDYWIRLRPFASNLDSTTLVIKFKEISYTGDSGWEDVTSKGSITMFDAGGGLLGIDFFYAPIGAFHHNAIVYVDIEVYDTAAISNIITLNYWFKLIQDYKIPYIENHYPPIEGYNVFIDTYISFDLIDVGEGVDIDTLEVFVNERNTLFSYDEYEYGNYHIRCDLPYTFYYGQAVNILVDVMDRSDNANRLYGGWKFYCSESSAPWFNMDNTHPKLCIEGTDRQQPVSMQVYGINNAGIEYDSIKLEVGGKYRNMKIIPIVYRLS